MMFKGALNRIGRFTGSQKEEVVTKGNCPGSSAKSGLWPRQRPESQFFQRKFAYRPPLRGGTWAPSRGTWAVTTFLRTRALGLPASGVDWPVRCAARAPLLVMAGGGCIGVKAAAHRAALFLPGHGEGPMCVKIAGWWWVPSASVLWLCFRVMAGLGPATHVFAWSRTASRGWSSQP